MDEVYKIFHAKCLQKVTIICHSAKQQIQYSSPLNMFLAGNILGSKLILQNCYPQGSPVVCDRKIYGRNNGRYYGRKAYGRNVSAIILFRSHRSFKMSYIEAKSIKIWLSY